MRVIPTPLIWLVEPLPRPRAPTQAEGMAPLSSILPNPPFSIPFAPLSSILSHSLRSSLLLLPSSPPSSSPPFFPILSPPFFSSFAFPPFPPFLSPLLLPGTKERRPEQEEAGEEADRMTAFLLGVSPQQSPTHPCSPPSQPPVESNEAPRPRVRRDFHQYPPTPSSRSHPETPPFLTDTPPILPDLPGTPQNPVAGQTPPCPPRIQSSRRPSCPVLPAAASETPPVLPFNSPLLSSRSPSRPPPTPSSPSDSPLLFLSEPRSPPRHPSNAPRHPSCPPVARPITPSVLSDAPPVLPDHSPQPAYALQPLTSKTPLLSSQNPHTLLSSQTPHHVLRSPPRRPPAPRTPLLSSADGLLSYQTPLQSSQTPLLSSRRPSCPPRHPSCPSRSPPNHPSCPSPPPQTPAPLLLDAPPVLPDAPPVLPQPAQTPLQPQAPRTPPPPPSKTTLLLSGANIYIYRRRRGDVTPLSRLARRSLLRPPSFFVGFGASEVLFGWLRNRSHSKPSIFMGQTGDSHAYL
ncbi:hypothetical protein C7M84_006744 [Penaeus vannamei]|uniref:Uncharacterized protein n=1 Tax=Penaeus vannamei TaxID=6689 RepID=A0A3R7QCV1_PENVA|nr:hypothetical protein C7M84_006744 [Penaeus vannamei]